MRKYTFLDWLKSIWNLSAFICLWIPAVALIFLLEVFLLFLCFFDPYKYGRFYRGMEHGIRLCNRLFFKL